MSSSIQLDNEELDEEWMQLILNARNMGLSSTDIRTFLKSANQPALNLHNPTKNEQMYLPIGLIQTAKT
jgi:DNA-binding transcriptional MerR regulator